MEVDKQTKLEPYSFPDGKSLCLKWSEVQLTQERMFWLDVKLNRIFFPCDFPSVCLCTYWFCCCCCCCWRSFQDVGSNNSGYYELTAVLTHQGRSSTSGHYVGWVRKKDGTRTTLVVSSVGEGRAGAADRVFWWGGLTRTSECRGIKGRPAPGNCDIWVP